MLSVVELNSILNATMLSIIHVLYFNKVHTLILHTSQQTLGDKVLNICRPYDILNK